MTSSVSPSTFVDVARIVWLIVSPVVSAAAMIVVPSISPTMIRAVRPRRRGTLRTPSLKSTITNGKRPHCPESDGRRGP